MKTSRVVLVCVLVFAFLAVAGAQRGVLRPKAPLRVASPLTLTKDFQTILKAQKVPADKQSAALTKFRSLPPSLQQDLLGAMDEKAAIRIGTPVELLPKYKHAKLIRIRPELLLLRRISGFFPEDGSPGNWAVAFGTPWSNDCQVVFDGTPLDTTYLNFDVDFFPNSLAFTVPAGATKATDHNVKVIWPGTTNETGVKQYRIVAPRGYRGFWGWKFANFSDPTIPWACYRDFFGADAVEYPGGAHRPAAQAWYDSTYKGVGGGGNCYGMSVSSLRERDDDIGGLHSAWFAANIEDYVWPYGWCTQTKETVQEYQGGQASAEVWALINHYYNHQSHQDAWNRIQSLCSTTTNRPVMGFWWPGGGGHAVVPYKTEVAGDAHRVIVYDNNHPYAEGESGSVDPDVATIGWAADSFSYVGANKMICLSYDECTQPQHLPTEATGGGMGMIAAVFEQGARVGQIQDAQGRRFFNANGSINENPATRIPDSMKFVPFMGRELPAGYPEIFIFNNSTGKELTFEVGGQGQKMCRVFMPGDVFEVAFNGTGPLKFLNILTNTRALEIPAPDALQPTSIRSIKAVANERTYQLQNLRNLGPASLLIRPTPNGNSLNVESQGPVQFDLRTASFGAGQVQQGLFNNIAVAPNELATVAPANWNALGTTQLNLQILNLQTKQQIRSIKIGPGQ